MPRSQALALQMASAWKLGLTGRMGQDKTQARRVQFLLSYNVPKLLVYHGLPPPYFSRSRRPAEHVKYTSQIASYMTAIT